MRLLKSLFKNLLLSLIVMGPGIFLMSVHPFLGGLWMLVGSFWLMAKSYRRPWRLNLLTSLLPPVAVAISYLVQLTIFRDAPSLPFLLGATAIGVFLGLLRGGTHKVFIDKGSIFAQRSVFFLFIWLACYGFTQLFALLGQSDFGIGRIAGAFSTAMLVAFSIVLIAKYFKNKGPLNKQLRAPATGIIAVLICGTFFIGFSPSQADNGQQGLAGALEQLIKADDLWQYGGDVSQSAIQSGKDSATRTFTILGEQRSKVERVTGALKRWTPMTTIQVTLRRHDFPILPGLFAYISNRTYFDKPLTFSGDMATHRPQTLSFGQYSYLKMTDKGVLGQKHWTYADAVIYDGAYEILIRIEDGNATGEFVRDANWENWGYEKTYDVANQLASVSYSRMSTGLIASAGLAPDPEKAAVAAVIASLILVASGGIINISNDLATIASGSSQASARVAARHPEPPLIYDGIELKPNEKGQYQDPKTGDWLDRKGAKRIIRELENQKRDREKEIAATLEAQRIRANKDWDDLKTRTRIEGELHRRTKEGDFDPRNVPDWVKEKWPDLWEDYVAAGRLDEFNRREALTRNWLEENYPERLETLDKILERTAEHGGVTREDLAAMRAINEVAFNTMSGKNTDMAAFWSDVGTYCDYGEIAVWEGLKAMGTMAACSAAAPLTGTALIIGGSVGWMQSWSRGDDFWQTGENIVLSGTFNQLGWNAGQVFPESILWSAGSSSVLAGSETFIRTRGDWEATKMGAAIGFLAGGAGYGVGKGLGAGARAVSSRIGASFDDAFDDIAVRAATGQRPPSAPHLDVPDIDAPRLPPGDMDAPRVPPVDLPDAPGSSPRIAQTPGAPDPGAPPPRMPSGDIDAPRLPPGDMDAPRVPPGDAPDAPSTPARTAQTPDAPERLPGHYPDDPTGAIEGDDFGSIKATETSGTAGPDTGGVELGEVPRTRPQPIVPEEGPFGGHRPSEAPEAPTVRSPDADAPPRAPDAAEQRAISDYPEDPYAGRPIDEGGSARVGEDGSTIKSETSGQFPDETGGAKTPQVTRRPEPIIDVEAEGTIGAGGATRTPSHGGIEGPDGMARVDPTGSTDEIAGNLGDAPAGQAPDFDGPIQPRHQVEAPGPLGRANVLHPAGSGEIFDIHGNQIGILDSKGNLVDMHGRPIRELLPGLGESGHGNIGGRARGYIDADGNRIIISEPRIGPNGEVIPGQMAIERIQTRPSSINPDTTVTSSTYDPCPELDVPNRPARPPDADAGWDMVGANSQGQMTGRDGQIIGTIDSDNIMRTVDGEEILGIGIAHEGRVPWYRTKDGIVWTSEGGMTPLDRARMNAGAGDDPALVQRLIDRIDLDSAPTGVRPPPGS
jgi:membrane protein CcdC involved in cytochrome C biogenesis